LIPQQRTTRDTIALRLCPDLEETSRVAPLRLRKENGLPVLPNNLQTAHTEKIRLLTIDRSLTDYHHEHPRPGAIPGEYAFSFVPRKAGPYRVWADLLPMDTGRHEYVMTDNRVGSRSRRFARQDGSTQLRCRRTSIRSYPRTEAVRNWNSLSMRQSRALFNCLLRFRLAGYQSLLRLASTWFHKALRAGTGRIEVTQNTLLLAWLACELV
jgi:hypothetical protein